MTLLVVRDAARFLVADILGDAIRFPVWWYTTGLALCLGWVGERLQVGWHLFGVGVWAKNVLTPMFGQRDVQGRIISFAFRIVQIVARTIGLLAYAVLLGALFVLWVTLPLLVILLLVLQLANIGS